jgi:hypothetical protein
MRTLCAALTLIGIQCLAQAAPVPGVAPASVIDCSAQKPAPPCQVEYDNGGRTVLVSNGIVKIGILPYPGPGTKIYARIVAVWNDSKQDIDFDPETMMTMSWKNGMSVSASDPDTLIDHYEHRANFMNGLGTLLDQVATGDDNAIAVDSAGGHSVAYGTSLAQERGNARSQTIQSKTADMRTFAFRHNTLQPGKAKGGIVYFEKPKCKNEKKVYPDTVTIKASGTTFIF